MYCTHCGTQNMDQARFCQKCGQALVPVPDRPSVWNRWRVRYPLWLVPAMAVLSVLCLADVIIVALLWLLPALQKGTIAAAVGPTSAYGTPTTTPTPPPTSTLILTPTAVPPTRPAPTPTPTPTGVSQGEMVWSEPVKISNNVGYLVAPSIIADDEGHVYAVWEEHNPTVREKTEDLYFAVHYNIWDGTSWLGQQDIPHSTNRGEPRVTIDREGHLHVSWVEQNLSNQEAAFYYSKWDKRTWTNPLTIPLPSDFPIISAVAVAVDSTNRVHFISGLDHIWLDDTAWSTLVEIPNDGKILAPMDLVADQDGNLHLITAQTGGQINELAVHYSRWDGASWSRPAAIAVSGGCSGISSMALDRDGRIHVAMQTGTYKPLDKTGTCWIAYTQGNEEAWTEPITISEVLKEPLYGSPRIAVDSRGHIHVVWCDDEGIYYAGLVGETWSTPVILSKGIQGPNFDPDVTIDSQGNIHVLWAATVNGGAVDVYHTVGSIQ